MDLDEKAHKDCGEQKKNQSGIQKEKILGTFYTFILWTTRHRREQKMKSEKLMKSKGEMGRETMKLFR